MHRRRWKYPIDDAVDCNSLVLPVHLRIHKKLLVTSQFTALHIIVQSFRPHIWKHFFFPSDPPPTRWTLLEQLTKPGLNITIPAVVTLPTLSLWEASATLGDEAILSQTWVTIYCKARYQHHYAIQVKTPIAQKEEHLRERWLKSVDERKCITWAKLKSKSQNLHALNSKQIADKILLQLQIQFWQLQNWILQNNFDCDLMLIKNLIQFRLKELR